jgi:glucose 1-dehydrogenase
MGELDGRVAIVTGGGSGIGHAIATRFGREGAHVAVNYHGHDEAAERLAAELSSACERSLAVRADVSRRDEVERMVDEIGRELGPVEILVNNAGIEGQAPILELEEDDWNRVLGVNLTGAFLGLQACARVMRGNGGGSIVNISSVHEDLPFAGQTAYAVSKGGLRMLMRNAAVELAELGIRVNNIAPGPIATPIQGDAVRDPEVLERIRRVVPLARFGEPEEVAEVALFLASDRSAYVTGATYLVDGGLIRHTEQVQGRGKPRPNVRRSDRERKLAARAAGSRPPGPVAGAAESMLVPQRVEPRGQILLVGARCVRPGAVELVVAVGEVRVRAAQPGDEVVADPRPHVQRDHSRALDPGAGGLGQDLLQVRVVVGEPRQHGCDEDERAEARRGEVPEDLEPPAPGRRPRLDHLADVLVERPDAHRHARLRDLREAAEEIEVADDHRRLRQHRHRVAEVRERLDDAARQPVAPLAVLVRISRRPHRDRVAGPARRRELAPEHLDHVRLHDDLRGEVLADAEVEVAVERPREAVVARVRAAAVGVDRPAERHASGVGHPVQRRLAGVLEKRNPRHAGSIEQVFVP